LNLQKLFYTTFALNSALYVFLLVLIFYPSLLCSYFIFFNKNVVLSGLFFWGHYTARQIQSRLKPKIDKLFNCELEKDDRKNRVVIHTLRHTFASHLAIQGTPIFTIQKLMNHKDIKQTMRYAKLAPDSGRNFVNDLYR
jgi:hypothetical protein